VEDSFKSAWYISSLRVLRSYTIRLVRFVCRLLWSSKQRPTSLQNCCNSLYSLGSYWDSLILPLHTWGDHFRSPAPDNAGVSTINYLRHPKEHNGLHHVLTRPTELASVWLLAADDSSNFYGISLSWLATWSSKFQCKVKLLTDNPHSVVDALHIFFDQQKELK